MVSVRTDIAEQAGIADAGTGPSSTGEPSSCVLLFVRYPEMGYVKTRLSTHLDDETIVKLYDCFVRDLLTTLDQIGSPVIICYHPPERIAPMKEWLGSDRHYMPQHGEDLGERMYNAFTEAFSMGFQRVLLVGSDIPDLPLQIIERSLTQLEAVDMVLGPSQDGGYYLIGFRKDQFHPDVFRDIPWGTNAVLPLTRKLIAAARMDCHELPEWNDIDTFEDVLDLMERNRGSNFTHSMSYRFLKDHMEDWTSKMIR